MLAKEREGGTEKFVGTETLDFCAQKLMKVPAIYVRDVYREEECTNTLGSRSTVSRQLIHHTQRGTDFLSDEFVNMQIHEQDAQDKYFQIKQRY